MSTVHIEFLRGAALEQGIKRYHADMHIVSQSHPSRDGGNKISLSKLRGNNYLALLHVSKVRKALSLPKVRLCGSVRGKGIWQRL